MENDQRNFELSVIKSRDVAALERAFCGDQLGEAEKTADELLPDVVAHYNDLHTAGMNPAGIVCRMLTEMFVKAEIMLAVANDRRRELELRVQQLEARPALTYEGVFQDGKSYEPGMVTTDSGSMWHCDFATKDRPGTSEAGWTLCVKRGRDAK